MQFKLVRNAQKQQDLQHNSLLKMNETIGYVLYDDNTTKEIKDLTEDEIVEIFCEYINTYNAGNEPYISIEKFAVYNEQLQPFYETIREWLMKNYHPHNNPHLSLLAKLLKVAISNKSGDKILKYSFGISLKKLKNKKWIITQNPIWQSSISKIYNKLKDKKAIEHNLSEITVDEIIEELETQIEESKNTPQQDDDADYLSGL